MPPWVSCNTFHLSRALQELAHLWYWQQQQQQGGGSRGVAVDGSGRQGHHQQQHSAEGRGEASPAAAPYASAPASSNGDSSSGPASSITSSVTTNTTTSSSSSSSRGKSESLSAADRAASSSSDDDEAGAQAAHAQATPEGEEDDGDDLWARVDATLKKRQEQAAGRAGQRPGAAGAEAAAGAGTAGGGGAGGVTLPGGHVLRPEVWSLLEAASRGHSGSGSVNVRCVTCGTMTLSTPHTLRFTGANAVRVASHGRAARGCSALCVCWGGAGPGWRGAVLVVASDGYGRAASAHCLEPGRTNNLPTPD